MITIPPPKDDEPEYTPAQRQIIRNELIHALDTLGTRYSYICLAIAPRESRRTSLAVALIERRLGKNARDMPQTYDAWFMAVNKVYAVDPLVLRLLWVKSLIEEFK